MGGEVLPSASEIVTDRFCAVLTGLEVATRTKTLANAKVQEIINPN